MFDHGGFDCRDLKKSEAFYKKALAPLGINCLVSENWGSGFGVDRPQFWLGPGAPTNGDDELHIAFTAKNRAQVRAFYEAAIAAGARDLGEPGMRPQYHENYYGAFVLDPDGHNIEACCHLPE
jgi:catechol 2,3-dioxygenase-like lactoylglutathione lyase family enzyme